MSEQIVDICLCEMTPATKIAGVPALVCTRCDERIYSAQVSERLDDIRDRFDALAFDHVKPMLIYEYESTGVGQTQLTFTRDEEHRMAGVTTLATVAAMGKMQLDTRDPGPVAYTVGTAERREAN